MTQGPPSWGEQPPQEPQPGYGQPVPPPPYGQAPQYGQPPAAPPPPWGAPPPGPPPLLPPAAGPGGGGSGSRRWLWGGLGVLVLAGAGLGLYFGLSGGDKDDSGPDRPAAVSTPAVPVPRSPSMPSLPSFPSTTPDFPAGSGSVPVPPLTSSAPDLPDITDPVLPGTGSGAVSCDQVAAMAGAGATVVGEAKFPSGIPEPGGNLVLGCEFTITEAGAEAPAYMEIVTGTTADSFGQTLSDGGWARLSSMPVGTVTGTLYTMGGQTQLMIVAEQSPGVVALYIDASGG